MSWTGKRKPRAALAMPDSIAGMFLLNTLLARDAARDEYIRLGKELIPEDRHDHVILLEEVLGVLLGYLRFEKPITEQAIRRYVEYMFDVIPDSLKPDIELSVLLAASALGLRDGREIPSVRNRRVVDARSLLALVTVRRYGMSEYAVGQAIRTAEARLAEREIWLTAKPVSATGGAKGLE